MAESEWISAAEAARRLGIKQATLYSYVSRGVLTRRRAGGGRGGGASGGAGGGAGAGADGRADGVAGRKGSLFDPAEVEELARRGRPRRPPGLAGLVIESGVTEIADNRLWFRGLDALDLAWDWNFEDVCELLWDVRPGPDPAAGPPGPVPPVRGPLARTRGSGGRRPRRSRRARPRKRRSRLAPSRWNGSR